ncbi:MAG: dTDP-4-dehydrorhamnose reductase [Candidatus Eremiobacteraeota bacterium]|nr:dTDP-4-dehydrorhamnose reductase [Candidatus Eremiobacteraeota bacterium]
MKVLLVGAGGQLAQHLIPNFPHLVALTRHQLDLTDRAQVTGALRHHRPDCVINAAAYTAVDLAEEQRDQAFATNADAPAALAQECQKSSTPLVHFSTDYVFPGGGSRPWKETDACSPINQYGASKWAGEEHVRRECEQHLILRVSWLFGAFGQNFVKTILRLAGEREQLRVVSDQQGCPTWCGHLSPVVQGLLESRRWGTYHYCDAPASNWWEFARTVVDQAVELGWPLKAREVIPISTADFPTKALRPTFSVLDCTRLAELGIFQSDWCEGLERTLRELGRP